MLVQHLLEKGSIVWPNRVALVCSQQRITYSQLDAAANRLANALIDNGVERGDRVAILLENSIEVAVALFAALKAGAIFMILQPGMKRGRLAMILEDAEPTALISDRIRMREHADIVAADRRLRLIVWADDHAQAMNEYSRSLSRPDLATYPNSQPYCPSLPGDLATIIYTSGSTGQPKGVMCAHSSMLAATISVNAYLDNSEDDVILDGLPLSFGYGLYQIFLAFQVGGRVVIEKNYAFPARTIALLQEEGITALPGVPTFFAMLLQYPHLLRRDFPRLRYMTNAAAALPTSHLSQLRSAFPHTLLYSMYGQTECKRVCYLPPAELDRIPSSVGIPIPNSEVYIVSETGERVPHDEVGELVVRGPHVMQGYWRAPQLTAQRFRPGPKPGERVLYTGDLFKMDKDGFLYFISRKDDIIKCRGEKVSPLEVENVVCEMPGVAQAAVVGVPDPVLGQAIRLFVVRREDSAISERDVRAYCTRTLSDYMVPKYIDLVQTLPRNDNGKVDRRQLALV